MTLTKSEYLLFLKHRAWLWLKKYEKELLPPIDANTQAMFDAGNKLEAYAEALFPEGVRLGFNNYNEYKTLGQRTKQAIAEGNKVIFQGRFDAGDLICLTDVVEFTSPTSVNLYEIKSSTKVKPEHELDLAFQAVVLEDAGYSVGKVSVIHVDTGYVRSGDIEPAKLLKTVDMTEAVLAKRDLTRSHASQALRMLNGGVMPDISPRHCRLGSMSDWLPIYRKMVEVPERSIYDLYVPQALQLGALEDAGVTLLQDIPEDFELSEKQLRQVASIKQGEASLDKEKIKEFLGGLEYPLYFFDYETCSDVIPPYDGVRPYQQVPCQYSLHILEEPGGDLRHTEYIHRDVYHPGNSLAEALKKDIGTKGSVIVWYAAFEGGRNQEMAELFPDYADLFNGINDRMADLMVPFAEGWYADPAFMGSSSIKKVLPILVPELSYKGLAVQEGATAQRLWMQAVLGGSAASNDQLFTDLLSYCELDTLAMVRIYEVLERSVAD